MQKAVKDFIKEYKLQADIQIRCLDLVSEVGELSKEIIKATNYGKKALATNRQMFEEAGDCLFSLLALFCEMNVDAEDILKRALEKYKQRFIYKGDINSS
ncbi:MAG: hypothetical protein FWE36_01605 [Erysipelotrichales bacterium]|nr:hypothetical protein [Erysipelotrichales bacterium]